ncbi:MAG: mechanosensitive ion channel family protein [Firmicutes bacterium]|nr:mechanosensitive ion channel family protein [Bacillota bacterium]
MYTFILERLQASGIAILEHVASNIAYGAYIIIGLAVALVVRKISRVLLVKFFTRKGAENATVFVKNRFFMWLSNLSIPIILSIAIADIGRHSVFWTRFVTVLLVVIIMFLMDSIIRSIGDIYSNYEVSKTVPIRGVLQIMEIAVFIVGAIILISIFVDRSPVTLLSGLGAMTAIVTIVFKDAILGFVAGIQLTANDLVRVGDVIEIPQRDIIGVVTDISLVTVKVEGLDKTIVAVPAYALISEPFVNRRGILVTGARRIMRSFGIDANTVRVCDEEMVAEFKKIPLVADHVQVGMTNIGIFREYITAYLRNRSDIDQDLTLLVRHLQAAEVGIPFEVYAFANEVDLVSYEGIQADIFEHIYAIMPEFGLKLYQRPSGYTAEG